MTIPLVIAHRGNSSAVLENSLAAIQSALHIPVDMIEIDVRMSSDNVLYVMHDRTSNRTATADLDMEISDSCAIEKLRLRNNEPIPRLDAVLDAVNGKAGLNIEIKSIGAGVVLKQQLLSRRHRGELLVSSFHEAEVLPFIGLSAVRSSLIYDSFSAKDIATYSSKGYRTLSLKHSAVTDALVHACRDRAIQLYVWTVDEEKEMRRLISLGVDGIYSNKPAVLKRVVAEIDRDADKEN
jgi:glycerophosphoryl diester phosphodiesterase